MKEIDLTKCTVDEYMDWFFQEIKPYGGVAIFPNGYITSDMLHKLTEAYRTIGQREGYKRGKRDGSRAGYQVGYDKGFDDGYSFCQCETYTNYIETGWL